MRLVKPFLILAAGLLAAPVFGGGLSKEKAFHEFFSECAQCAAYFGLRSRCFVSSGQLQGGDKTSTSIEKTRDFFQLMHYSIGKAAGMSDRAIKAHFAPVLDSLLNDIDKNCANISVILKKYATFCKELAENPDQQLDQLMTKGPPTLE
jgi:hypothetical protein